MNASDGFSFAATIVILFPMIYFLVVTPNFFFCKFSDTTVTWVMRGLFNTYFLSVCVCGGLGMVAFALAGHPVAAAAVGLMGGLAGPARRWFLHRIDAQLRARDAGDAGVERRLRRLHLGGMLYNTVQFAAVLAGIPFVFVAA